MNKYHFEWVSLADSYTDAGMAQDAASAANAVAARGWQLKETTYVPVSPTGKPGLLLTFEPATR